MGLNCYARVWEHSCQRGSHLVLLLALADRADDDGVAFPKFEELVERTRSDERTVKRLLAELEADGELFRLSGQGAGLRSNFMVASGFGEAKIAEVLAHHPRLRVPPLWARERAREMAARMTKLRLKREATREERAARKLARQLKKKKKVTKMTPFSEGGAAKKGDRNDTFFADLGMSEMAEKGVNFDTKKVTNLAEKGDISDIQTAANPSAENSSGPLTSWNSHGTVMNSQGGLVENSAEKPISERGGDAAPTNRPLEVVPVSEGLALVRDAAGRAGGAAAARIERWTLEDADPGAWVVEDVLRAYEALTGNPVDGADRDAAALLAKLEFSSLAVAEIMRRVDARRKRAVADGQGLKPINHLAYFRNGVTEVAGRCRKRLKGAASLAVGKSSGLSARGVARAVRSEVDAWEPQGEGSPPPDF